MNPPTVSETLPPPRPLVWLLGGMAAIVLATLLAAHLPDRAKLLGLFPLIWGAATGGGLRWWANECRLAAPRWLLAVSCVVLAAGEAGIVLEAWRMHRTDLQRQFDKDPSAGFVKQAQQSTKTAANPEEAALREQLQAEVERIRHLRRQALSLPAFLHRRLKALGDVPQPWPEVFWVGEILLGSLCGTWVMKSLYKGRLGE